MLHPLEGLQLYAPLEELLDLDVHACVWLLLRHNAVDGGVGKARFAVEVLLRLVRELALDEAAEAVGGANHVLAGDNRDRVVELTVLNTLGDDRGDELENVWPNGTGHSVGRGDLLDDVGFVVLAVDGPVVVDGEGGLALVADLGDFVAGGILESLDEVVHHIYEDDFVA